MSKQQIFRKIRELHKPPPDETAFITAGGWYWADGRWLFPEQIAKHRGPLVQWFLTDEPTPERVKGADMIQVDNWRQGDELARATLNKEPHKVVTSFGYVLKTLQADDQTPQFLSVHYATEPEPQQSDLEEYSQFLREQSDIEENE